MDIYNEISEIKRKQDKTLALLEDLRNGVVENQNKVYDLTDIVKLLNVSKRTIFKWKNDGKMNFSQIGKKLYVTDAELKRFLVDNNSNKAYNGRK